VREKPVPVPLFTTNSRVTLKSSTQSIYYPTKCTLIFTYNCHTASGNMFRCQCTTLREHELPNLKPTVTAEPLFMVPQLWTDEGGQGGDVLCTISAPALEDPPGRRNMELFPGREIDHSPPSSVEVKNEWSYASVPPYAFMAWTGTALPLYF
jgi:hypothetical protein